MSKQQTAAKSVTAGLLPDFSGRRPRFFVYGKPLARRVVQKQAIADDVKNKRWTFRMSLNDSNSLSHTKWNCKYHIVFAPKYRRKVFYREKRVAVGKILR